MKRFANLVQQIDETNKTNQKVSALVSYFDHAPEVEKVWAIAIMSHRRPKRPVTTTELREWCRELTAEVVDEMRALRVGDRREQ